MLTLLAIWNSVYSKITPDHCHCYTVCCISLARYYGLYHHPAITAHALLLYNNPTWHNIKDPSNIHDMALSPSLSQRHEHEHDQKSHGHEQSQRHDQSHDMPYYIISQPYHVTNFTQNQIQNQNKIIMEASSHRHRHRHPILTLFTLLSTLISTNHSISLYFMSSFIVTGFYLKKIPVLPFLLLLTSSLVDIASYDHDHRHQNSNF